MARVDQDPAERDTQRLQLQAVLDCPECDTPFDWVFTAPEGIYEREDLIDPVVEKVACPACGHEFEAEWSGWHSHEDAG